MASKESELLERFFNSSKHWHFEELRADVGIGKPQLARWLKVFEKEGVIKRIKPRGKMPYYIQNASHPNYKIKKRLYAWQQFAESGLLEHLMSMKAKTIILFGSFARSDWNQDSDVDIFVYGDCEDFEQGTYESKIKRDIEVHTAKTPKDLKRIDKMLPYVLSGEFIKGSIQDLGVTIHA